MQSAMKLCRTCRRVFMSKHFRTLLMVLLAFWVAAFMVIGGAVFYRIRNSLENTVRKQMSEITLSLADVFNRASTNAVTVGNLDSVDVAIGASHADMDAYAAMADDLNAAMAIYEYQSVDLFMENAREIYVSQRGLYRYAEYPQQELLRFMQEEQPYEAWLVGQAYRQYYAQDTQVLTYIRRLPIYHSSPDGYVAFHIPMEYIRQLIERGKPSHAGTLLINLNGSVLYSDDSRFPYGGMFPSDEELSAYGKDAGGILICSDLNTETNCCYVLPRDVLNGRFFTAMSELLVPMIAFLVLILICSFGYSLLMIGPLDKLLHQIAPPVISSDGDEYQQLSKTVTGMSSCIDLLTDELRRNLQPIQERYILDLTTNYTDISIKKSRYEEIGISFPYSNFAVILADCAHIDGVSGLSSKEQTKLLLRDRLEKALEGIGIVYSANLTEERLLFLINSQSEYFLQQIRQACTDMSSQLQNILAQAPIFSVGSYTATDVAVPYYAYLQARNNIAFSGGACDGEPLLADAPAPVLPSADFKIADSITGFLLDHDLDGIQEFLAQLFDETIQGTDTLENERRLAISCLCLTLTRMLDLELNILPEQAASTIKKISHTEAEGACIELLTEYFSTVIKGEKRLPAEAENHIKKAVDYIHSHYTENITIPEIAENVALSPIYLNKLFKLSTGRTISDYLNLYRAERAKEMLACSALSLNEISSRLGYNDVRSLVRFFKKYNGMTPGEYRQSVSDKGGACTPSEEEKSIKSFVKS